MNPFTQALSSLRAQMNARITRPDVLQPLALLTAMMIVGLLLACLQQAPQFVLIVLCALLSLLVALYAGAYVYCLHFDRDALRTEKLSRLANVPVDKPASDSAEKH